LVLALLSPLGIILPRIFHAGGAWGEGSTDEVKKGLGFVPKGMGKNTAIWKAPLPNYGNKENKSITTSSLYYMLSGIVGVGIIALLTWLCKIYLKK